MTVRHGDGASAVTPQRPTACSTSRPAQCCGQPPGPPWIDTRTDDGRSLEPDSPTVLLDANTRDGDGCDRNCRPTACGNLVITTTTGEQCDDGNLTTFDTCSSDCCFEPPTAPNRDANFAAMACFRAALKRSLGALSPGLSLISVADHLQLGIKIVLLTGWYQDVQVADGCGA